MKALLNRQKTDNGWICFHVVVNFICKNWSTEITSFVDMINILRNQSAVCCLFPPTHTNAIRSMHLFPLPHSFIHSFLQHSHIHTVYASFICTRTHTHTNRSTHAFRVCVCVSRCLVLHAMCRCSIGDDVFIYTCKFAVESLCCSFAQAHRPTVVVIYRLVYARNV